MKILEKTDDELTKFVRFFVNRAPDFSHAVCIVHYVSQRPCSVHGSAWATQISGMLLGYFFAHASIPCNKYTKISTKAVIYSGAANCPEHTKRRFTGGGGAVSHWEARATSPKTKSGSGLQREKGDGRKKEERGK